MTDAHANLTQRSTSTALELLQAWHLADLRKSSAEQVTLTPAGLINADRKRIDALLESASGKLQSSVHTPALARYVCLISGIGATVTLLAVWACWGATANNKFLLPVLVAECLLDLALLVTLSRFYTKVAIPMQNTARMLAEHTTSPVKDFDFSNCPSLVSQMLETLEQNAASQQLLFDSTIPILLSVDSGGLIKAANGRCFGELGFLPGELLHLSFLALFAAEDSVPIQQALNESHNNSNEQTISARAITRAKDLLDMELTIHWSNNAQLFFVSAKNITDSKMLERARKEYVATLAHDIKTPLSSAWTSLSTLSDGHPLENETATIVRRAEANLERVLALLDELLTYERSVELGRYPLSIAATSTKDLVDDVIEIIEPLSESTRLTIESHVEDVIIHADSRKMQRVLENLLSNAIKFAPRCSKISVAGTLQSNEYVFVISDDGPGIPAEFAQTIFRRYERLPSSEQKPGSGLGLSICKAIVEAHGGQIGVRSDGASYSQFWLSLPIAPASDCA